MRVKILVYLIYFLLLLAVLLASSPILSLSYQFEPHPPRARSFDARADVRDTFDRLQEDLLITRLAHAYG